MESERKKPPESESLVDLLESFPRYCLEIFVHTHSWIRCALMSTNDNTACATQVTKESVIFPRSEDRPHGVLP